MCIRSAAPLQGIQGGVANEDDGDRKYMHLHFPTLELTSVASIRSSFKLSPNIFSSRSDVARGVASTLRSCSFVVSLSLFSRDALQLSQFVALHFFFGGSQLDASFFLSLQLVHALNPDLNVEFLERFQALAEFSELRF